MHLGGPPEGEPGPRDPLPLPAATRGGGRGPAPFRFRPRRFTASRRSAPRRRGRGGRPLQGFANWPRPPIPAFRGWRAPDRLRQFSPRPPTDGLGRHVVALQSEGGATRRPPRRPVYGRPRALTTARSKLRRGAGGAAGPGPKRAVRGPRVVAPGRRRAQKRAPRGTKSSVANSPRSVEPGRIWSYLGRNREAPGSENKASKSDGDRGIAPRSRLPSARPRRTPFRCRRPGGQSASPGGRRRSGRGSMHLGGPPEGEAGTARTPSRSRRRPGAAGEGPAPFRFRPRRSTASRRSAPRRRGRGGRPASGLR